MIHFRVLRDKNFLFCPKEGNRLLMNIELLSGNSAIGFGITVHSTIDEFY